MRPVHGHRGRRGAALLSAYQRGRRTHRPRLVRTAAPLGRGDGAQPGAYDEQGPVFIHAEECEGPGDGGGYPFARPGALRALRRYDAEGRIAGGRLLEIPEAATEAFEEALREAFAKPGVVLVHVRAVEYGCFQFEVRR